MSWSVRAVLAWLAVSFVSAYAFEVGEVVVVIQNSDLTAESGSVEKLLPGDHVKIIAVEGQKMSVTHDRMTGTLSSEHVVTLKGAEAALTNLIRQNPRDVRYYCGRGLIWIEQQEFDKAVSDFTEAIKIDPKSARAYRGRGAAFGGKRQFETAIADYADAILFDPSDVSAYIGRGKALCSNHKHDEGIADFTKAIRINPNSAEAYESRAQAWFEKQKFEKAVADCTESIRIDPHNDWPYNLRGCSRYLLKEYDNAISDFTEAIRINAKNDRAYNGRGLAWDAKLQCNKAISDFNAAIQLNSNNAVAHRNRGWAWEGKREYEKALADYAEAIRLEPTEANNYFLRGNVLLDQANYAQAIDEFNKAINCNPTFAQAYLHRGYARFRNGDPAEAALDWGKANQIDRAVVTDERMLLNKDGSTSIAVIVNKGKMGPASVRQGRNTSGDVTPPPNQPQVRGLEHVWTKKGGYSSGYRSVDVFNDGKSIVVLKGINGNETAEFIDTSGGETNSVKLPTGGQLLRRARFSGKDPGELLLFDRLNSKTPLMAIDHKGVEVWTIPAVVNEVNVARNVMRNGRIVGVRESVNRPVSVSDVWVADLDGDGRDEVIVGYSTGGGVQVIGNNGKQWWRNATIKGVWHIAAGDLDGNGVCEIIASSSDGKVHVFDSDGKLTGMLDPKIYANWVRAFRLPNASADSVLAVDGPNEKMAVVSGKNEVIWRIQLPKNAGFCQSLAVSPNAPWSAVSFPDGRLLVIDLSTGKVIAEHPSCGLESQIVWALAMGEPLMVVTTSGNLTAWRVKPETAGAP